ncbi:hypothetical protein HDV03_005255 [Kappamyces sp. JEL0829]|nr:hypothetical protein HDV03_005255 [Kappamyces sp. JEL0829]
MPAFVAPQLQKLHGTEIRCSSDQTRLTLESILGQGSYSIVYKAKAQFSNRPVAVKCVSKRELNAGQIYRQIQEAQILQELQGVAKSLSGDGRSNIVRCMECIQSESIIYLVLEHCGPNLFTLIAGRKRLNVELAFDLMNQLLQAVAFIHKHRVYHRDLKPENVLLASERTDGILIKVADFGLATRSITCYDFGCGSIRYMSPECLNAEARLKCYNAAKNDVFSSAIILINMLSGKNPWRQASLVNDDGYRMHFPAGPAKIDSFRRVFGYSDKLCLLLRSALAKEPDRISATRFLVSHIKLNGEFFDPGYIAND